MSKITKHIVIFDIIVVLLFVMTSSTEKNSNMINLGICLGIYIAFLWDVIKIIYNRRKIIENSKYPILLIIVNVFVLNVLILSLIVWELSQRDEVNFVGINKIWDAVYFTIVSFSTVGYGDILPISGIAKFVVVLTICSNILLLVIFVNFFIMRAKKKENYLKDFIWNFFFLFEQISSECSIIEAKYKKEEHTIEEWVDIFIDILQRNMNENPQRIEEINEALEKDREYNRKLVDRESIREIPYRYINGQDEMLIRDFVYNCQKLIKEIEILEHSKIMLLENENLSENTFFILTYMKQDLEVVSRQYRYERKTAFDMTKAWIGDLRKQINDLGYGKLMDISFCGYNTDKSVELILALNGITIQDTKDIFWLKVRSWVNGIMKI